MGMVRMGWMFLKVFSSLHDFMSLRSRKCNAFIPVVLREIRQPVVCNCFSFLLAIPLSHILCLSCSGVLLEQADLVLSTLGSIHTVMD